MNSRTIPIGESKSLSCLNFTGETLNVLYVTPDLGDTDNLIYRLRKTAPRLRLDGTPGGPRALERIESARYDVLLLDDRLSCSERSDLITHAMMHKGSLRVVLVIAPYVENQEAQELLACMDGSIIKGPNFVVELLLVLQNAVLHPGDELRQIGQPQPALPDAHSRMPAPSRMRGSSVRPDRNRHEKSALPATKIETSGRRASPRWEIDVPCLVIWNNTSNAACIRDLSSEGAFIECQEPMAAKSEIVICIHLADLELQLDATIAHQGWYLNADRNFNGFGIRFNNLTQEAAAGLKKLRKMSAQPAIAKITLER